jgi:hypothetical protein
MRKTPITLLVLCLQLTSLGITTGCGGADRAAPKVAPEPVAELAPAAPAMAGAPPPPAAPMAAPAMDMPASDQPAPAPASAPVAKGAPRPAPAKAPVPPPSKAPADTRAQKAKESAPANAKDSAQATARAPLLIYVGDVQMAVEQEDFAATLDKVIDIAESFGGYLAGRKDNSVQVRVPSQHFREGLARMEKLGEVQHRSVSAEDVSEQYSDLETRLLNLKAARQRLQELLARAGTMADMLQVTHELERVAGEIDQIEGKMRYLRSRAAFSLVTVTLAPKPKSIPKVVETPAPRELDLPIDWLSRVNIGRLLNLRQR